MADTAIRQRLEQGVHALGLDPAVVVEPCLVYLEELLRWNQAYNLTAITEPDRVVTHHLLDSLTVLPYLNGDRCLDVGTGAGLPGLILAIAEPERHWVLLDSRGKKIRFLQHMIRHLGLGRVEAVHTRVEDYHPAELPTTIVSRALSSLTDYLAMTAHLRGPGWRTLAMKGRYPAAEIAGLSTPPDRVERINVPGLDEERTLVVFDR